MVGAGTDGALARDCARLPAPPTPACPADPNGGSVRCGRSHPLSGPHRRWGGMI